MKRSIKNTSILILVIIVLITVTGCNRKVEEFTEKGFKLLEEKDYDNAISMFEGAVEEDKNPDTVMRLNMAKDYVEISTLYDNYKEEKKNRMEHEINIIEDFPGNDELFEAKTRFDTWEKKYEEYKDEKIAKELKKDINDSIEKESELIKVVIEYNVATTPLEEMDYLYSFSTTKEKFNFDDIKQFLVKEDVKYIEETISERIIKNEEEHYYPLKYLDEQEEYLYKLFPDDSRLAKTISNVRVYEKERQQAEKAAKEAEKIAKEKEKSNNNSSNKNEKKEIELHRALSVEEVPPEYSMGWNFETSEEALSNFLGIPEDNIEYISEEQNGPKDNWHHVFHVNGEEYRVYITFRITKCVE